MSADTDMAERIRELCHGRQDRADTLIEILHDVQAALKHIPEPAIPIIAGELNLSRAEVHGVVSFYHDFRTTPPAGPVVKLCRAEACQAMGCDELAQQLEQETDWEGHAPEIRTVYCLGNCALSPAAMVEERLIGRADARKIAHAVARARDEDGHDHD